MPKFFNICLLFLLIPFLLYSIIVEDSLKTLLETSSVEDQIPIYIRLSEIARSSSLIDAENYANTAIDLSLKTVDPNDNIIALLSLAEINKDHGNFIETYNILQRCLDISTKKELTESKIKTLIQLSRFYNSLSEFDIAINLLEQALTLSQKTENEIAAEIYLNLGYNNIGLNRNNEALYFLDKASEIFKNVNNSEQYVRALLYTGKTYMNIDDYETAMKIDYEALEISKGINDIWATSLAYTDLAWAYFKVDNFERSLEYNLKALKFRNMSDNKNAAVSSLINTGILYKNYNRFNEAIEYLNRSLAISEESKYFRENMNKKRSYQNLYEIYEEKKDSKKSLYYLKSFMAVSDSINRVIKNDKLRKLQTRHHIITLKNEQKVKENMQRQKNMFLLFISLIVFLIASYIAYDRYKKRNLQNQQLKKEINERIKTQDSLDSKNKRLELMNRILRHDLANGLAVIQSGLNIFFAEKDEKILKEIYKRNQMLNELIYDISDFERFMTSNPDLSIFKLSDLIKEISPKFNVEIDLKNSCTFSAIKTIATVFNNIIENAISHGEATKIEIVCETRNNYCEIRIANNGKDIPPKIMSRIFNEGFKHGKSANTGMGLSIVKKAMEQSKGSVSIKANKPQGAVFILTFRRSI